MMWLLALDLTPVFWTCHREFPLGSNFHIKGLKCLSFKSQALKNGVQLTNEKGS